MPYMAVVMTLAAMAGLPGQHGDAVQGRSGLNHPDILDVRVTSLLVWGVLARRKGILGTKGTGDPWRKRSLGQVGLSGGHLKGTVDCCSQLTGVVRVSPEWPLCIICIGRLAEVHLGVLGGLFAES